MNRIVLIYYNDIATGYAAIDCKLFEFVPQGSKAYLNKVKLIDVNHIFDPLFILIIIYKTMPIIEAEDIHKSYGELKVLNGISLRIEEGEIVAITGQSGAGKSTLLHILGTLDTPDSGQVLLNNQNPFKFKSKELSKFRNEHIGFVFQFHHLLSEFTAIENILLPASIARRDPIESRKRAEELLSILHVADRRDHKPSQLSGGEQQRIAMARALINNPDIILADEPTGNLDSKTSDDLHNLILELRQEFNQTFVIVTHNNLLADLSDRIIHLADGKIESSSDYTRE